MGRPPHACSWERIVSDVAVHAQRRTPLPTVPGLRLLRRLWDEDESGRSLLACLCTNARDALLRYSARAVLPARRDAIIMPHMIGPVISESVPGSYSHGIVEKIAPSPLGPLHLLVVRRAMSLPPPLLVRAAPLIGRVPRRLARRPAPGPGHLAPVAL